DRRGGDGRVGRVGPGVHVRHARARAREHPRRGDEHDRRALARHADRRRVRPRGGHGPARVRRPARPRTALRQARARRGRGARARRRAPRRAGLPPTERRLGDERRGERGSFHEPTVFTGVRNDMTIAQEEIFGPVMSILSFSTEEEAYGIANDTEFGLAAGVWTSDLARAHRAGRALRVGTVWVNTYQMVSASVPYGGGTH